MRQMELSLSENQLGDAGLAALAAAAAAAAPCLEQLEELSLTDNRPGRAR